ncbi:MAG: DUF1080 domain-containing protein [Pirellulales bacterium]|nr:DUF1080 domain-containing protein [Pirellulales bacterium]
MGLSYIRPGRFRRAVLAVLVGFTSSLGAGHAQDDGLGYRYTPMLPNSNWRVHDRNRPQPPKASPGKGLDRPPDGAIVLFDGTDFSQWEKAFADDADTTIDAKLIEDGAFNILKTGWIRTKRHFRDFQFHVEWATPEKADGTNLDWGNSGVFFHGQYELQILESYENKVYADGMAGAIYGQTPPSANAARRPGRWQSFDVAFIAPRFDGEKLLSPAYITVRWNGVLVHERTEIMGSTRHLTFPNYRYFESTGPIVLQPHRSAVRFRNIWIKPLETGEKNE